MNPQSSTIKSEEVSVLPQFCYGCYSVDRTLTQIGDLADVYYNMLDDRYLIPAIKEVKMCWECRAVFRKIKLFKHKVNNVHNFLNGYFVNNQGERLPDPLTSLKVKCINLMTVSKDEETVKNPKKIFQNKNLTVKMVPKVEAPPKTEIVIEFKEEIIPELKDEMISELKQEIDDGSDENWDNVDIDNFEDFAGASKGRKKRDPVKNKIKKKDREKPKYEVIDNTIQRDKHVPLYKKVKIKESEVKEWMDRDRKNEHFLQWPFRCDLCVWGTIYERTFLKHNAKCHTEKRGACKCDHCSIVLVSKIAMINHLRCHNFVRQCKVCDYQCYTKSNMLIHIMKYHERVVKCLSCGHTTHNTKLYHKHHKEMHSTFICDYCGKKCTSRKRIKLHLRNRHGSCRCYICNRDFKNTYSLNTHNLHKHPASPLCKPELSYCVECDKQFDSINNFKRHLHYSKAHQGDRGFVGRKETKVPCPECDRVYARKQYMLNHYRHFHLKQTKFYCDICDRYFLNATRFRDHRRLKHEGYVPEKNKLCTMCGRGFTTNRILEKHIRTHTGERPFECTFCDAKFTQKESQQSHIKHIHLKLKRHGPAANITAHLARNNYKY